MKRVLSLFLAASLLGATCQPPPPPSDGGGVVVTPSGWTDTASTVLRTIQWAIPAAQAITNALIPAVARPVADRAFLAVQEAAGRLQTALDAYNARGGDRCAAYAAVGGVTTAMVGLARVLADNGIGLGNTLIPVIQSLGAVTDQLVPACQRDAGYASVGEGAMVQVRAIEASAMSRGVVLRPALDNLRPVSQ